MVKGTIALDIDGTITDASRKIPDDVVLYLESLSREGWRFILITGRNFSYAMNALGKLNFPFYLGVQNGADLLSMPENKHLCKHYFTLDVIDALDQLYQDQQEDFIVYSGYEKGDFCYYRPRRFSPSMQSYLNELMTLCEVPWQELESFANAKQSLFPLIKCFGTEEACRSFEQKLTSIKGLQISVIKDPISPELFLVLVGHENANKGSAVSYFMKKYDLPHPLITGGDDNNDIPLLKIGDVRIAMENSPDTLQDLAHVIAPSSNQSGIIRGLGEAIERLK